MAVTTEDRMTKLTGDCAGPVHWLDYGGPADGPLVVAVHGLGGAAWNWSALAPLLTGSVRLLAVDLAGHGLTPARGRPTTVQANRRLLDRFIDVTAGGERVVLLGNSMGGLISALEAARSPERIRGAVLVDAALPRPVLSRVDPRVAAMFAAVALPGLGESAIRRRRGDQDIARQVKETLALCCVDRRRVPADVVAEGIAVSTEARATGEFTAGDFLSAARSLLRILSRPAPVRRRLRAIQAPVLMLHGDKDRLVSVRIARSVARHFPDWQLEVAPDIGHVPMLEAPEWTAEQILRWLAEQGLDRA